MHQKFLDRADAGRQLALALSFMELHHPLIFALPRGGVPVAVEIAKSLDAPLDLLLVRKIGTPREPEIALGAIVEGANHEPVLNEEVKRVCGADDAFVTRAVAEERAELERREARYLKNRTRLDPHNRTVVIVDDGLATGATMKAALIGIKRHAPRRIVVALPVAAKEALEVISDAADDILCLKPATTFWGVSNFYHDFHQLSDEETVALLDQVPSGSADTHFTKPTIQPN